MRVLIGMILLCVVANLARAQDTVIVRDRKAEYVIVLEGTNPAERRGAEELQEYIKQISGADILLFDKLADNSKKAIIVRTGKELAPEEFLLQTKGDQILITGGSPRGTMYGCTALLEKLGVRFFTPKVTRFPKKTTITFPHLDERQSPAFEYRETDFFEAMAKDWAAHLRFNGASHQLDDSVGGKIDYGRFVHTLDELLPQDLFKTHPEYFPLINGKRTSGYVQRCLTNPDVLKLAIERVEAWIKEKPDAKIYSVSQNDTGNWCQCDQCKAIADKFGGNQSGLYLWFVNQVAEAIEKDHPDKLIDTLAYQFTEAPPSGISPRKNVRVRLCPIDCCEAHPYERCDTPANRKFVANLAGWAKLTDTLYIWHYNTDFGGYLQPFPDFDQFPDSVRLYKRSGVKGIFFEGDYAPGGGSADAELKSYVMAKLLWDPSVDATDLVKEWIYGVYGPAAAPMKEWFALLHTKVRDPNLHLHIYDPPTARYLTPDVIETGDRLFDEAEKLAASDPIAAEYVAKSRLGLRYVKLMQHPQGGEQLDRFLADVRRFGITQLREGQPLDQWEKDFRGKLPATAPAR
jgi:hypothetical protein